MNDFQFYIPLLKSSDNQLVGTASTLSVDRDNEKMSENALQDMAREIMTNGVNLFGNHEHNWENTLGVMKKAKIENGELKVGIDLDDPVTNQKVVMMLNKLKRGIKLGLSVGGAVTKEREEYNREVGKRIKVIDGVKLYEISVVGIPSNTMSFVSLPQAISKCMKENKTCPICNSPLTLNSNNSVEKCRLCLWSE